MAYDAVVLGAGVSGLIAAHDLSAHGSVCVIDAFASAGGNHKSFEAAGYTFDIGTIFFRADDPLFRAFPGARAQVVEAAIALQKIRPDGTIGRYPYSSGDLPRGPWGLIRAFSSLLFAKVRYRTPANTEEYARYYMGAVLYEHTGLANYINRMFGVEGRALTLAFAQRRMDWIGSAGSFRARIRQALKRFRRRPSGPAKAPAPVVVRPPGGFADMYQPIVQDLVGRGVAFRLGEALTSITKSGDDFIITGPGGRIRTARLISTIPLEQASDLLGLPPTPLPHAGLTTLFFSYEGERGFPGSVLLNFSRQGQWKRLTMHSDYYGARGGRQYLSVEVPTGMGRAGGAGAAADFRASTAAAGLFPGSLTLEGETHLDTAYPVYVEGAAEKADAMMLALSALGVEPAGRQGRFDYLPTAKLAAQETRKVMAARTPAAP